MCTWGLGGWFAGVLAKAVPEKGTEDPRSLSRNSRGTERLPDGDSKELRFMSLPCSHVSGWEEQLIFHRNLVTFQTVFSASV